MAAKTVNAKGPVSVPATPAPQQVTMKDWINKSMGAISRALPSVITPERFARMATTAVTMNPKLGQCTPESFIGAMLSAAQLGLEPNTPLGQAYLIPYHNYKTGKDEAQFQLGYKGLIQLAIRTGEFKSINAEVVREADVFEYSLGFDVNVTHKPALRNRGAVIGVYATYELKSGGRGVCFMSVEDINEHRKKYSKAKNSPWDTAWEGMAKKTVLKQVLKYAPLSSEFVRQTANEDVTLNFKEDIDDEPLIIADEDTRAPETEPEVIDVDADVYVDEDGVVIGEQQTLFK